MAKVVKEIITMLLVCLVTLLLFAVVFYEYIPARKNVAEVTTYSEPQKVAELLVDDIDKQGKDVLLTYQGGEYEVTSSDLKNYQATEKYVPGKANPFAVVKTEEDNTTSNTTNSNKTNSNTNKSDTNTTSTNSTNDSKKANTTENTVDENKTNTFINDKGTK